MSAHKGSQKRVRPLKHDAFAFMHVARDNAFLHAQEHVLAVDQKLRDDARYASAAVEDGFGQCPHQADGSPTINQPDIVLGQNPAEACGCIHEGGSVSRTGSTVDANGSDCAHDEEM
jgi:hypothetical protein